MRSIRIAAAAFSLLCFTPVAASAQDDDPGRRAAAQALFDQAAALTEKHDYAGACPKLEEVTRLQPGKVGALLALSDCYAGWGRVASAWATYRRAADRAATLGDARALDARAKADALAPRLPRLSLRVDAGTAGIAGIEVKRDGATLGAATWAIPIPIDPGEHVIEASAPKHAPLRIAVTVKEGEAKEVAVTLQIEAPIATPPLATAPAMSASPSGGAPDKAEPAAPTESRRRTAGLVVGGIGVAGLGVAGALGIVTLVKVGSLPCSDPSDACTARRNPIVSGAETTQTAGFVMLGVGAAATVAGVVLFATSPRTTEKASSARIPAMAVSAGLSGVSLRGVW